VFAPSSNRGTWRRALTASARPHRWTEPKALQNVRHGFLARVGVEDAIAGETRRGPSRPCTRGEATATVIHVASVHEERRHPPRSMSPWYARRGDAHRDPCRLGTRGEATPIAIHVALVREERRRSSRSMSPWYTRRGDTHRDPCRLNTRGETTPTAIDVVSSLDGCQIARDDMGSAICLVQPVRRPQDPLVD
jgi:hypothetical protein